MNRPIYMDYNATAPMREEVIEAMADVMRHGGNPSSVHGAGQRARKALEAARVDLAHALGCRPEEVVLTSGGTEANNLAITGTDVQSVIVSAIEHDSVLAPARARDLPVHVAEVDQHGVIDLDAFGAALAAAPSPALVCVMLANNEIGTIQPVAEIAALARQAGAVIHTDAVQAFGKGAVSFDTLGVDLMSVSAHKIAGPPGVGALIVREGVVVEPLVRGGGQEMRRRSGTENLPGIAGFAQAARIAMDDLVNYARLKVLRDRLEAEVLSIVPDVRIVGREAADRLVNTSSILLPGVKAETQVMALDLDGICISSGSACSSGKVQTSHVLIACGFDEPEAGAAIRVSLGWNTDDNDIDDFVKAYRRMVRRVRKRSSNAA